MIPIYRPGTVQWSLEPITGRRVYGPPTPAAWTFGQEPAPNPPPDPNADAYTISGIEKGLKSITPTLFFVGIATGIAFALGSALANHYILKHR